jgi:hypothetical protein
MLQIKLHACKYNFSHIYLHFVMCVIKNKTLSNIFFFSCSKHGKGEKKKENYHVHYMRKNL